MGEEGASESQRSSSSDKSRTAAAEAQRLGSLGSWADNFAGETPATNRTSTASTVDGDEVRNVQYPQLSQELDPSDPPPVYTPSDTTQSRPPTEPASPVVQRSVPVQPETVSPPITVTSSSSPYAQRPFRDDDGSDLPEPVQHPHHSCHHHQNRRFQNANTVSMRRSVLSLVHTNCTTFSTSPQPAAALVSTSRSSLVRSRLFSAYRPRQAACTSK